MRDGLVAKAFDYYYNGREPLSDEELDQILKTFTLWWDNGVWDLPERFNLFLNELIGVRAYFKNIKDRRR